MIRIILFLAIVTAGAIGASWLLDRPGEVTLVWQGNRYDTSLMVLLVAVAVFSAGLVTLWAVVRSILNIPETVSHFFKGRRHRRGMHAIARGLVAVGVGDVKGARLASNEAGRLIGNEPLALLLSAQTAQLQGDKALTEQTLKSMLDQPCTRALGLRGLFVEARRQGRVAEALRYAEEAARFTPDAPWVGQALLELHTALYDWDAALKALDMSASSRLIDRPTAKKLRSVILVAKAARLIGSDNEKAKKTALEAAKLSPDFVPATALAAKLLTENNETRRASRLALAAWERTPHPDLAEVYLRIRTGDTAQDRLKRARTLVERAPTHIESALALARAALDAREFSAARKALEAFMKGATRRICLFMAELEEQEGGDFGRARQWLSRAVTAPADPAWEADGIVSDRWMPASPVTGRLDAFEWKVPAVQMQMLGVRVTDLPSEAVPAALVSPTNEVQAVPLPPPTQKLQASSDRSTIRPSNNIIPLAVIPDDPGPSAGIDDGTPQKEHRFGGNG
jgi:HemY protein